MGWISVRDGGVKGAARLGYRHRDCSLAVPGLPSGLNTCLQSLNQGVRAAKANNAPMGSLTA